MHELKIVSNAQAFVELVTSQRTTVRTSAKECVEGDVCKLQGTHICSCGPGASYLTYTSVLFRSSFCCTLPTC